MVGRLNALGRQWPLIIFPVYFLFAQAALAQVAIPEVSATALPPTAGSAMPSGGSEQPFDFVPSTWFPRFESYQPTSSSL